MNQIKNSIQFLVKKAVFIIILAFILNLLANNLSEFGLKFDKFYFNNEGLVKLIVIGFLSIIISILIPEKKKPELE